MQFFSSLTLRTLTRLPHKRMEIKDMCKHLSDANLVSLLTIVSKSLNKMLQIGVSPKYRQELKSLVASLSGEVDRRKRPAHLPS